MFSIDDLEVVISRTPDDASRRKSDPALLSVEHGHLDFRGITEKSGKRVDLLLRNPEGGSPPPLDLSRIEHVTSDAISQLEYFLNLRFPSAQGHECFPEMLEDDFEVPLV